MNRKIATGVAAYISGEGFTRKGDIFYRTVNDVVQGFEIRTKRAAIQTLLLVSFNIHPLCDQYTDFADVGFGLMNIGELIPECGFKVFGYSPLSSASIDRCVSEIQDAIGGYLLPYFDSHSSCKQLWTYSNEIDRDYGTSPVFIALKIGLKEEAVIKLKRVIENREMALADCKGKLSEEMFEEKNAQVQKMNHMDRLLLKFIERSSQSEIEEYLKNNENNALKALGVHS